MAETGAKMANQIPCNPTVTVIHGTKPMNDADYQRFCDAQAKLAARLPEQISDAVRKIVAVRGVEPREGFVANELSVALSNGVEVSVEGRGRGKGIAIVRVNGQIVAHGFYGTFVSGAWQRELSQALEEIWHDEMNALALPGCAYCKGFGSVLDEGEFVACECTERQHSSFAVIYGANQSQRNFNHVAEQMAA